MRKSLLILGCLMVCLSGLGACSSSEGTRATASMDDSDSVTDNHDVRAYKPVHSEITH